MKLDRRCLIVPLCLVLAAPFFAGMWKATDGHIVMPLDDAYIYQQYARQLARGMFFRYNSEDPPTSGTTSLLYPLLLAGGYLAGFRGEALSFFAFLQGVMWLIGSALLVHRIAEILCGEWIGCCNHLVSAWGSVALFLSNGALLWAYFSGMEGGMFTFMILALLYNTLRGEHNLSILCSALLALTRPEGALLAIAWVFINALRPFTQRWAGRSYKTTVSFSWRFLLPLLAAGLQPLLNWYLTGSPVANGTRAKSWLYNVPFSLEDIVRVVWANYKRGWIIAITGIHFEFGWGFMPFGLSLVGLLFLVWQMYREWRVGNPGVATLVFLWIAGGLLAVATMMPAFWHYNRYQIPFYALLILCGGAALVWFSREIPRATIWIWWAFLLLSLPSIPVFVWRYAQAIQTAWNQQIAMAEWINQNLPLSARVGVHDAGAVRYFGGRYTYDLVGLTTPDAAQAHRQGPGAAFESMETHPGRPTHFATYPDIPGSIFGWGYFEQTSLLDRLLAEFTIHNYSRATSALETQAVYVADWRLAGSGERFYQSDILERTKGLTVMDTLDVADLDDEEAHRLRWWHEARRPGFPTEVWQMHYRAVPEAEVLDGGRLVTGGMAFQVRTCPDEPLWIVGRLHAQQAGAVRVLVNGHDVGRWAYPPLPGEWLETLFRVPGDVVTGEWTEVILQVDARNPDFLHYAPYYFWFLQGESRVEPVVVPQRMDVTFGPDLHLLGFDLPRQVWHPGDVIPIKLFWQATAQSESDAKVFVHLYDAEGHLGPQADGWAYFGTRPPYTWMPGEVVRDPVLLRLPHNIVPGHYSIEVGLYRPDGSGRLPALRNGQRSFFEDRVPLSEIEVR